MNVAKVYLSVTIPQPEAERLDIMKRDTGLSISAILRQALIEALDRHDAAKKTGKKAAA